MYQIGSVDRVLELATHGRLVSSHLQSQVHWRGQKSLLHFGEDESKSLDSLRIRGDGFYEIDDVADDFSNIRRLTACAIERTAGRIVVAPTGHRNSKMTVTQCKDNFLHSVDNNCRVRVAVIFSEEDGIDGVDLGWYTAVEYTGRSNGCFLILERDASESFDVFPFVERVGQPTVVTTSDGTTHVTNSFQESRFVRLFDALEIPFVDEHHMSPILLSNGSKYLVDYLIYPGDPDLQAFVEVKPFQPTDAEIMKAGELHRATGIDVFLVWGTHFVAGLGLERDKWTTSGTMNPQVKYASGIRGARISTDLRGEIEYEDGYYFMANDLAGGAEWTEEASDGVGGDPYHNKALARFLEGGGRRLSQKKRTRFAMRSSIHSRTRVVTTSGRRFRPVDKFKPHLHRFRPFAMHQSSTHTRPGPGDWNSERMQTAFAAARKDVVT